MHGPWCMPIFNVKAGPLRAALSLLMLSCISKAASTALAGSTNAAITESPIVLTSVPSHRAIVSRSRSKCRRTRPYAGASPITSYNAVEAFRSVNMRATAPTEIGVSGASTSSEKSVRNSLIAMTIAAVVALSFTATRSSMTVMSLSSLSSNVSETSGPSSSASGSSVGR